MQIRKSKHISLAGIVASFTVALLIAQPMATAQTELVRSATWEQPRVDQLHPLILSWTEQVQLSETARAQVLQLLANEPRLEQETIQVVSEILALLHVETEPVLVATSAPVKDPSVAGDLIRGLDQLDHLPLHVRNQVDLSVGRWLARNELYDEALEVLAPLKPADVVDPSSLLFYRGLSEHALLKKQSCVQTLTRLLERESFLPRRYAVVSRLMLSDIAPLKADSLDEISRMMLDIQRRQALYRSGTRVRDLEKNVVEKLDKLIEELEQQMQQSQSQADGQANPSTPMQDSQAAGGTGKGDVNQREQTDGGAWGDLPPKEREAALADMAKDLPPHYREVIEEYFRQLARQRGK